jgi:hypothetical protein
MLDEILAEITPLFPSLIIMKPDILYCEGESCNMSLKGLPLYRDDDHLNEVGAKLLAQEYLKQFSNPFKSY